MFARHDLIWLTPLGWYAQLAAHPRPLGADGDPLPPAAQATVRPPAPDRGVRTTAAGGVATLPGADGDAVHSATSSAVLAARTVLERWRDKSWPLIVRRREPGTPEGFICAGLAAPPDRATGAKLRIPLVIDARHIARHERPLPLHTAQQALPAHQQEAFNAFADVADAAQFDMRVYGSLAMQALTAQSYLHAASDIDIVFRPANPQALDQGVALLAAHAAHLPLDGEIVFPSGEAVAWKEWHASHTSGARVLVKKASCVALRPAGELRMELEAA